jgi:hypothetical protein
MDLDERRSPALGWASVIDTSGHHRLVVGQLRELLRMLEHAVSGFVADSVPKPVTAFGTGLLAQHHGPVMIAGYVDVNVIDCGDHANRSWTPGSLKAHEVLHVRTVQSNCRA